MTARLVAAVGTLLALDHLTAPGWAYWLNLAAGSLGLVALTYQEGTP